jgi:vacuolar-type H+-ATPase subunit E/Vma4
MSQNTLIEKIKQDAAQTVAEIKSTGATQVEGIEREIETKVAELKKVHDMALLKTKAQMELVAISKAKQAGNIAIQSAKRNKIDAIFTAVAGDLENQASAEYVAFFQKYASEIIPQGVEATHVHAPATRATETAEILKNLGLSGTVTDDASCKAGMVIHTKDGVYDITLNRLMSEKRAELEMVVVNKVMA